MSSSVDVEPTKIGDINGEWLRPAGAPDHRALLYLHGGAYTMGSCITHRALASRIAAASRIHTLLPDLCRAPEHPFPAALEDSMAAYLWLIEHGVSPHKIAVAGDSSGGSLAVALSVLLREKRVALPAAIACISPWADLELTGESLVTRAQVDPICSFESSRYHAAQYVGNNDAREPLISPIYADLHGLSPMLIQVGDREILLSDAVRLADRAREDGVIVELEVWDGMWHVWHLFAGHLPEGQHAIDRIGAFILTHVD
jgi:acetyl esterase/lipase